MKIRNSIAWSGLFIILALITANLAEKYESNILWILCIGCLVSGFTFGISCLPNLPEPARKDCRKENKNE